MPLLAQHNIFYEALVWSCACRCTCVSDASQTQASSLSILLPYHSHAPQQLEVRQNTQCDWASSLTLNNNRALNPVGFALSPPFLPRARRGQCCQGSGFGAQVPALCPLRTETLNSTCCPGHSTGHGPAISTFNDANILFAISSTNYFSKASELCGTSCICHLLTSCRILAESSQVISRRRLQQRK